VDPADFGLAPSSLEDLRGGDAAANAEVVRAVLAGTTGPHRDIAVLNAAAGLVVAGISPDLAHGVQRAGSVIDEGAAAAVLDNLVRTSREAAEQA
jgi:anthranilate phosphoribosyltransferase